MRVHVSIDPALVVRVDAAAKAAGQNRSVFTERALLAYLDPAPITQPKKKADK